MQRLFAVAVLVSTFSVASCVQGQSSDQLAGRGPAPVADETTGEAQEALPIVDFSASDFPFVTTVQDDGSDKGGGWQEAKATLKFWKVAIPRGVTRWQCPIIVEMPLRTKAAGIIPRSHAATLSAEVANDIALKIDYSLPPGIFCFEFTDRMDKLIRSRYPMLGARVRKGWW